MIDEEFLAIAREAGFKWPDICQVPVETRLRNFARLIAARQREKDSEICLDQKYMVLQPTRIYTAYDICNAQKSAAEHLARAIRAQGEE